MNRLLILTVLLLAMPAWAADLCAGYGAGADKPHNCTVTPLTGGTSVEFVWDTNNLSDSMVLIGNQSGGGDFSRNVCETACSSSALVTHHDVTVTHLQPLSIYYWAVASCSSGPSCPRKSTNWSISPWPSVSTQLPVTTLGVANPSGTLSWFAEAEGPQNVYKGSSINIPIEVLLQNGTFSQGTNFAFTSAVSVDGQSCLPGAKLGSACGSANMTFSLPCAAPENTNAATAGYTVQLGTAANGSYNGDYYCSAAWIYEPGAVARLVTNGSTSLGSHTLAITFQVATGPGVALGAPVSVSWTFNVLAAPSFTITAPTTFPPIPSYGTWLSHIASKGTAEVTQYQVAFNNGVFLNDNMSPTQTAYDPWSVFNYDGNMIYKYLGDQAATVSATWTSGHPYGCTSPPTICQITANGYVWAATTAGTSGGTSPACFTTAPPGSTCADGGALVWTNGGSKLYWNEASEMVGMPYMDWAQYVGKYSVDAEWNIFPFGPVMDFYRQGDSYSGVCNGVGTCTGLAAGAINYFGGINRPGYANVAASAFSYLLPAGDLRNSAYTLESMTAICEITANANSCLSSADIAKRVDLIFNTIDYTITYSPFDGVNATYACCVDAPLFDSYLLGAALTYLYDVQAYEGLTPDPRIPVQLKKLYDWQLANFYNLTGTDYTLPYQPWAVSDNYNNPYYLDNQQLGMLAANLLAWIWAANGDACTLPASGLNCLATADQLAVTALNVIPYSGKSFNSLYEWLNNYTLWRTGAGPATDHYVLPNHNAFEGSYPDVLGPFNGQSLPPGYPQAVSITNNAATIQWYSFEKIVSTEVNYGTSPSNYTGLLSNCGVGTFVAGTINLWLNQCTVSGLAPSTTYYYSVGGPDSAANLAQSQYSPTYPTPFSFTTSAGGGPLTIATTSLPSGVVGVPYSFSMSATGGVLPYTWSIIAGGLPSGLGLSSSGLISGVPTTRVVALPVTIEVTDSASNTASAPFTMTIASAGSAGATTGSQGEISLGQIVR